LKIDFGSRKTAAAIVFAALLMRIALTPLHVDPGVDTYDGKPRAYDYCRTGGTLPFDFYAYVCGGQRLLEGRSLYVGYSIHRDNYRGLPYPPPFLILMAAMIKLFGANFAMLKLPAAFLDAAVAGLVFLCAENIAGTRAGNAAAALYAFSYQPLLSAGALGNDDHVFMFFAVLSTCLLLRGRPRWSALSMGAALAFKVSAALFIPAALYFAWRKWGPKEPAAYILIVFAVNAAALAPFAASEGAAALSPYNTRESMAIDGLSLLNIARLSYGLPYHALHPGILLRYNDPSDPMYYPGTNPFAALLRAVETPFTLLGLAAAAYYAMRRRMDDPGLELARNTLVFTAAGLIFSKVFYDLYMLWFLPYMFLLFPAKCKGTGWLRGAPAIYAGIVAYCLVWTTEYPRPAHVYAILWGSLGLIAAGSWTLYGCLGGRVRLAAAALMTLSAYFEMMNSVPFLMFYPPFSALIGMEAYRQATYYGGELILAVAAAAAVAVLLAEAYRRKG
jgi:hypothetical protein